MLNSLKKAYVFSSFSNPLSLRLLSRNLTGERANLLWDCGSKAAMTLMGLNKYKKTLSTLLIVLLVFPTVMFSANADWPLEFGYSPVLLETFVDTAFYSGTSYKTANWTLLGHTKGRGRMDRLHDTYLSPKAVFVYPLCTDFADILKGLKPYMITPQP